MKALIDLGMSLLSAAVSVWRDRHERKIDRLLLKKTVIDKTIRTLTQKIHAKRRP